MEHQAMNTVDDGERKIPENIGDDLNPIVLTQLTQELRNRRMTGNVADVKASSKKWEAQRAAEEAAQKAREEERMRWQKKSLQPLGDLITKVDPKLGRVSHKQVYKLYKDV